MFEALLIFAGFFIGTLQLMFLWTVTGQLHRLELLLRKHLDRLELMEYVREQHRRGKDDLETRDYPRQDQAYRD